MTRLSVFTKESKSPPSGRGALHCLRFHLPECLDIKLGMLPFDEKILFIYSFNFFLMILQFFWGWVGEFQIFTAHLWEKRKMGVMMLTRCVCASDLCFGR